jgi:hypothetical protein
MLPIHLLETLAGLPKNPYRDYSDFANSVQDLVDQDVPLLDHENAVEDKYLKKKTFICEGALQLFAAEISEFEKRRPNWMPEIF